MIDFFIVGLLGFFLFIFLISVDANKKFLLFFFFFIAAALNRSAEAGDGQTAGFSEPPQHPLLSPGLAV